MLYPLSYGGVLPMADLDRVADVGRGLLAGRGEWGEARRPRGPAGAQVVALPAVQAGQGMFQPLRPLSGATVPPPVELVTITTSPGIEFA